METDVIREQVKMALQGLAEAMALHFGGAVRRGERDNFEGWVMLKPEVDKPRFFTKSEATRAEISKMNVRDLRYFITEPISLDTPAMVIVRMYLAPLSNFEDKYSITLCLEQRSHHKTYKYQEGFVDFGDADEVLDLLVDDNFVERCLDRFFYYANHLDQQVHKDIETDKKKQQLIAGLDKLALELTLLGDNGSWRKLSARDRYVLQVGKATYMIDINDLTGDRRATVYPMSDSEGNVYVCDLDSIPADILTRIRAILPEWNMTCDRLEVGPFDKVTRIGRSYAPVSLASLEWVILPNRLSLEGQVISNGRLYGELHLKESKTE